MDGRDKHGFVPLKYDQSGRGHRESINLIRNSCDRLFVLRVPLELKVLIKPKNTPYFPGKINHGLVIDRFFKCPAQCGASQLLFVTYDSEVASWQPQRFWITQVTVATYRLITNE